MLIRAITAILVVTILAGTVFGQPDHGGTQGKRPIPSYPPDNNAETVEP